MGQASVEERSYRRRLGKVIVQLREATGMSQATLAERIGRSEAAVSRWETGKATPSAFDVHNVAMVFGIWDKSLTVLIFPPAVYSPEMEQVFESIEDLMHRTAVSGEIEGTRRARQAAQAQEPPAPSPRRLPRDSAAKRG